jgi:hypothetical protein
MHIGLHADNNKEGKADKNRISRVLPIALPFIRKNILQGNSIIIHCYYGIQFISITLTLKFIIIHYPLSYYSLLIYHILFITYLYYSYHSLPY